jgi:hypothetical protein
MEKLARKKFALSNIAVLMDLDKFVLLYIYRQRDT